VSPGYRKRRHKLAHAEKCPIAEKQCEYCGAKKSPDAKQGEWQFDCNCFEIALRGHRMADVSKELSE